MNAMMALTMLALALPFIWIGTAIPDGSPDETFGLSIGRAPIGSALA